MNSFLLIILNELEYVLLSIRNNKCLVRLSKYEIRNNSRSKSKSFQDSFRKWWLLHDLITAKFSSSLDKENLLKCSVGFLKCCLEFKLKRIVIQNLLLKFTHGFEFSIFENRISIELQVKTCEDFFLLNIVQKTIRFQATLEK